MLLAIDIGNSNITMGAYKDDNLLFISRLETDTKRTEDQYAVEIKDIIEINGYDFKAVDSAAVCSVVPAVQVAVCRAIEKLCRITPFVLTPKTKTELSVKIDDPLQIGADLIAGAVGAISKYKAPLIVIDMGTATTISVVNGKNEFLGGAISAGLRLSMEALTGGTAQLPMVALKAPEKVVSSNTADCMCSGIVIGSAVMIDGMIDRINAELGEECFAVATGGASHEVIKNCTHDIVIDDNLLLDGLKHIFDENCRNGVKGI